ncbi:PREDICTED: maestro heat-like repeat-containing protein family member 2B [Gavialis gangeticus]|uniref:maestro heat-like repeat-containing protein family member 2B n=1 Tax=Gavialis gangeticus TaxID=94835 RepID=UPI00092E5C60|nr:PREDICTED: maestro heat-like repeat-containing protein family member 2B [Gavialis gangeticus]
MLDFMKEEPMYSLASPVLLRAMLAIKHLSKVKPSLNLDKNRNILDDCVKCLLPLPAVQQLKEEGEMAQDFFQIQSLHELSMQDLGELMRGLLDEDPTDSWFMEMFHVSSQQEQAELSSLGEVGMGQRNREEGFPQQGK